MTPLAVRLAWQKILASGRPAEINVALLSSFTVNPLCPYIGMALEDAGLPVAIHVGPYDQISQQCLDPTSEIAQL
ncbi:MAG TPA: hypothetical protein VKT80_12645, partial [Chloroflexota bacterium]|nr:hypothetical protein [Chloroflexota bacterium]